jgi:hypothetical protein
VFFVQGGVEGQNCQLIWLFPFVLPLTQVYHSNPKIEEKQAILGVFA